MQRHGWTLLFHDCLIDHLRKLEAAATRAQQQDPAAADSNANVKLLRALSQLILEVVPNDPNRAEFRQGNTLGGDCRHWRRAKIGHRFRLFFRFDSKSKVIVDAWVNDENTLRSAGSSSDHYAVFQRMLGRGRPPDDWATLVAQAKAGWDEPS
jgi:toxin YhaV